MPPNAPESRLFPRVDGRYAIKTVTWGGRDWRLDDYSYAGYCLGQSSLGDVPRRVVTIHETGDISAAVQSAINTVGISGGGTVQIPAGTFTMSFSVAITFDNVSIEGEGRDKTFITIPSNYLPTDDSREGVFTFGKRIGQPLDERWICSSPDAAFASRLVSRGDMEVGLDDSTGIIEKDWILLQQYFWPALVGSNSQDPDHWIANKDWHFAFSYLRQVTHKSGDRISIDAPVAWTLDPGNNEIHVRLVKDTMTENVGLKGVTINFQNNLNKRTGRPSGAAVYFESVRNGWVHQVAVNNFPRYGLYANVSARLTFLGCSVQKAQDHGGGGYGYLISPSQNVLVRDCYAEDCRHNYICGRTSTSTVVISRCTSKNASLEDDTHHSFVQSVLWDKHSQVDGGSVLALNRGDESIGAYETLGSGVIWNFHGDGAKGRLAHGGEIHIKPSPDGWAMVLGVMGAHTVWDNTRFAPLWAPGDQLLASDKLQVGPDPNALQNVLYENLYGAELEPASLYEAQLANRIGPAPAVFRDSCV